MDQKSTLGTFLAHYFPTFICAFFMACFALSASISLASSTYFRDSPERAKYSFLAALTLAIFLALSHLVMIRGRSWGVWVIVAFYVLCFLTVLPSYGYEPHPVVYLTGVLFPLLGLLLLNSKRHREMRGKLVEIRHQRELIIKSAKASRPRR